MSSREKPEQKPELVVMAKEDFEGVFGCAIGESGHIIFSKLELCNIFGESLLDNESKPRIGLKWDTFRDPHSGINLRCCAAEPGETEKLDRFIEKHFEPVRVSNDGEMEKALIRVSRNPANYLEYPDAVAASINMPSRKH